jgi:hypothetical protein
VEHGHRRVQEPGLKNHPVCAFLLKKGAVRPVLRGAASHGKNTTASLLCSSSTKAHRGLVYPSQVEPGVLYLGSWDQTRG